MGLNSVADVAAVLRDATAVTVVSHTRPDADTIGAALALALTLRDRGAKVEVAHGGPTTLPISCGDLPGADTLVSAADIVGYPLVVSVDAASPDRLSDLRRVLSPPHGSGYSQVVVIDHHASNDGFGDVNLIDPQADSTCSLVLRVLDALATPLTLAVATNLYAGLITDTGSLRWASPQSLRDAARLREVGVDGARWSQKLLDTHDFAWLAVVATATRDAVLVPEACDGAGVLYATLDAAALDSVDWSESESIVDIIRTVDAADVTAIFKQVAADTWTVSLRSRGQTDVSALAVSCGGGGHLRAAGFTCYGSRDEVVAQFLGTVGG